MFRGGVDVASFCQSYKKPENVNAEIFYSGIIDLENTLEDINQGFDKGCRYDVRRAERDGVKAEFLMDLSVKELNDFIKFYNEFAKQKGLQKANKKMLSLCNKEKQLLITRASFENKNLVYHAYLVDRTHARLHHSCSLYRSKKNNVNGQMVGRANRWLHFEDMKYLKEKGFKIYDVGGIGKADEVKNISTFKEELGAEPKEYYDFKIFSDKAKKQIEFKTKIKNIITLKFLRKK
ncbi:MAG: aminoacyltransferase [Clostridiales bacterium]|nr:aminoacyltransferase [Clostridiales bacterium]